MTVCPSFFCNSGMSYSGLRDKYHSEKRFTSWTLFAQSVMNPQPLSERHTGPFEYLSARYLTGIYFWFLREAVFRKPCVITSSGLTCTSTHTPFTHLKRVEVLCIHKLEPVVRWEGGDTHTHTHAQRSDTRCHSAPPCPQSPGDSSGNTKLVSETKTFSLTRQQLIIVQSFCLCSVFSASHLLFCVSKVLQIKKKV